MQTDNKRLNKPGTTSKILRNIKNTECELSIQVFIAQHNLLKCMVLLEKDFDI